MVKIVAKTGGEMGTESIMVIFCGILMFGCGCGVVFCGICLILNGVNGFGF